MYKYRSSARQEQSPCKQTSDAAAERKSTVFGEHKSERGLLSESPKIKAETAPGLSADSAHKNSLYVQRAKEGRQANVIQFGGCFSKPKTPRKPSRFVQIIKRKQHQMSKRPMPKPKPQRSMPVSEYIPELTAPEPEYAAKPKHVRDTGEPKKLTIAERRRERERKHELEKEREAKPKSESSDAALKEPVFADDSYSGVPKNFIDRIKDDPEQNMIICGGVKYYHTEGRFSSQIGKPIWIITADGKIKVLGMYVHNGDNQKYKVLDNKAIRDAPKHLEIDQS